MPVCQFAHDGQHFVDHFGSSAEVGSSKSRTLGSMPVRGRWRRAAAVRHPKNRILVRLILQTDAFEQRHCLGFGIGARHLAHAYRRERDVAQNGEMRKQVEALEDHADFAADCIEMLQVVVEFDAVDDDFAPESCFPGGSACAERLIYRNRMGR